MKDRGLLMDFEEASLLMRVRPRAAYLAVLALLSLVAFAARASTSWTVGLNAMLGRPSGYVQVRENQIDGTPLAIRKDLGVTTVKTLRFDATRSLGKSAELHLWLSTSRLYGHAFLGRTAYFNGATLARGPIGGDTRFIDNWRFQASYWRRLYSFSRGGGLFVSAGLTFVSLNFRIQAQIAPGSVGHETKEDFDTQELPIPVFGVHVRYPLTRALQIFASFDDGHIPWTNTLRREGGMIQLTQTNEDASLGLKVRLADNWLAKIFFYGEHFKQNERSAQDGNFVKLNQYGIGLGVGRRF